MIDFYSFFVLDNNTIVNRVLDKKQNRYLAMGYNRITKKRHTISWAKYMMIQKLKRNLVPNLETVDNINNDCSDDRYDNLQLLSLSENIRKSATKGITMVTLVCPVCSIFFTIERRKSYLVKGGRETCCSRSCGGKRSHMK